MKDQIRIVILVCVASLCFLTYPLLLEAGTYRYVDENGGIHFTDDIQQVPENQRPKVIEEPETSRKSTNIQEPSGNGFQAPRALEGENASLIEKQAALFAKKKALDAEFLEIIVERDRLERERSIPGGPAEVKEYNDAVFRLKDRITDYQKRCSEYEANVKAFNEKMEALEKIENSIGATAKPAPGKSSK